MIKLFAKQVNDNSFGLGSVFSIKDIWQSIPDFISTAIMLAGVLVVIYLIIAGFQYLSSGGDEKKVEIAKKNINFSITGLVIVLFSYALVNGLMSLLGTRPMDNGDDTIFELKVSVDNCPPQTDIIRFSFSGGSGTKYSQCIFSSSKGSTGWKDCLGGSFDTEGLIADDGTDEFYIKASDSAGQTALDSCVW